MITLRVLRDHLDVDAAERRDAGVLRSVDAEDARLSIKISIMIIILLLITIILLITILSMVVPSVSAVFLRLPLRRFTVLLVSQRSVNCYLSGVVLVAFLALLLVSQRSGLLPFWRCACSFDVSFCCRVSQRSASRNPLPDNTI